MDGNSAGVAYGSRMAATSYKSAAATEDATEDNKVWEAYYHDSSKERREFYSIYIKEKKLDTIFEFGCASGPNLFHIDKNVTWDFYYFGYDVSLEAIKFARKKTLNCLDFSNFLKK